MVTKGLGRVRASTAESEAQPKLTASAPDIRAHACVHRGGRVTGIVFRLAGSEDRVPGVSLLRRSEVSRASAEAVSVPSRGYVLGPEEGVPGRDGQVKGSNASTGGSLAVYRTVVDGQGPPPHRHSREDETIIVLDGTMQADCGDDAFTGGPGSAIFLRASSPIPSAPSPAQPLSCSSSPQDTSTSSSAPRTRCQTRTS